MKRTLIILALILTLVLTFGVVYAADDPDPPIIKKASITIFNVAADDPDPPTIIVINEKA